MPLPNFKKLFDRIFRKKKPGYATFSTDVHVRGAAAETGSHKSHRFHFAKIRQRIQTKKRGYREEYSRPVSRKGQYARFGGALLVILAVPFLWMNGGGEIVRHGLQSFTAFKIDKVEVVGCTTVSKEKIIEASGIVLHQTSLLALDSADIVARLASVPWVAKAEVKKNWLTEVQITIEENAPIALFHDASAEGGQLKYLDNNGVAFSAVSPGAPLDFPVVTGLAEVKDPQVKEKALAEVLIFLRKVRGNDPHLPIQSVSEIHVAKSGDLVVYLVEYPFPIFFGSGNTKQKYSRLIQVLRALYKKPNSRELLLQIGYIQMDYMNDRVLMVERGSGLKTNG
jgi:cell division protein FtsQ